MISIYYCSGRIEQRKEKNISVGCVIKFLCPTFGSVETFCDGGLFTVFGEYHLFSASAHTFVNVTGARAGTDAHNFPGCLTRW